MSLELALQQNTSALQRLIALLLQGQPPADVSPAPSNPTPPPVSSEASASAAAAPAAEPIPPKTRRRSSKTAESTEALPAEEQNGSPSYDEVRDATLRLAIAKDREVVVAMFKRFNVEKATALKPEQYADYLSAVNEAVAV